MHIIYIPLNMGDRLMKRDLTLWQIIGFGFTALAGSLLHFFYDFTNKSIFAAPFSSINESTWEHMKLIYFPLFVFALIQNRFFKEYKNFWCIKLLGILTGLVLIPVLFYTYNGAIGKSPDWINISFFFIAAATTFVFERWLFKNDFLKGTIALFAFVIIVLIGILFVVFTFYPPILPLFQDPIRSNNL